MSRRRLTLDNDDVMNDTNEWLEDKPDDDAEDNLNELVGNQDDGDYDNDIIDCTEDDINKDERDSDVKETVNQRQAHFWKELTRKRLVDNLDTSLDKNNYKPTTYLTSKRHIEVLTSYLGPRINKNTKRLSFNYWMTTCMGHCFSTEKLPTTKHKRK